MRQFFRVGFCQVDDPSIVHDSEDCFLFCTPVAACGPMLTEEEALSRPIASPERVRPKLGLARELFRLTNALSCGFNKLEEGVEMFQKPPEEHPWFADTFQQFNQLQQQVEEQEEMLLNLQYDTKAQLDKYVSLLDKLSDGVDLRSGWDDLLAALNSIFSESPLDISSISSTAGQMKTKREITKLVNITIERTKDNTAKLLKDRQEQIDICKEEAKEMEEKIQKGYKQAQAEANKTLDATVNNFRQHLMSVLNKVDRKDWYDIILDSDAIHACAIHQNLTYMQIILDLLPEAQQKIKALNQFDRNGLTPLMLVASKASSPADFHPYSTAFELSKDMLKFYNFVESLIGLGADKNITNKTGRSALGYFWTGLEGRHITRATFRIPDMQNGADIRRMEGLLTPDQGATPADEEVQQQGEDDEVGFGD